MIVIGDLSFSEQISLACGKAFNPACDTSIVRVEHGQLRGGIIFTDYTGHSITQHFAGFHPYWGNRDLIWAAFDYPFNQLQCARVFGQASSRNVKSLELIRKLGFKIVATIPDVFFDGDLQVFSMNRDECKWLKITPRDLKSGR
jgi:RimJ/RimL family protein N-acetyltransferase